MTAQLLLPFLLTAAALLTVSGVGKLRDPAPAATALGELGMRVAPPFVRAAAILELLAATAVVVRPAVGAAAVAILYTAFALLVVAQLRRGATGSCGCLGAIDTPPTWWHVAVDGVLAAVAAAAAVHSPSAFAGFGHAPLVAAVVCCAAAACGCAVAAALELLPSALAAYRGEKDAG